MVMAQLGSRISRSPLSPVLVEGRRWSPTPLRRINRQRASTVAPSRSTSSQPMARHSPMRQPVASIITDRSGRSHVCAALFVSSASSHCWRSSAVSDLGLFRGVPRSGRPHVLG